MSVTVAIYLLIVWQETSSRSKRHTAVVDCSTRRMETIMEHMKIHTNVSFHSHFFGAKKKIGDTYTMQMNTPGKQPHAK